MKHIYLNLKRFDIPPQLGGVNRIAPPELWGEHIIRCTKEGLKEYAGKAEFTMYFPEAHIPAAVLAKGAHPVRIGCQGVYRADTAVGGAFGAFTSQRTGNAMAALGCADALIGHCEERAGLLGVLQAGGVCGKAAEDAVNKILNEEIRTAQAAGLSVLYCVGETSEQQPQWEQVLGAQLDTGLAGVDKSRALIAYEPIWSIGPGKTPANRVYIEKTARMIKARTGGLDVVYGGGLKAENAAMVASIPEVDGGLIALTRFSGEVGFYPDEYLEIVRLYLGKGEDNEA